MDTLDYIDDYFSSGASLEKKEEFEKRIIADPVFAGEVAFYLSAKQAAKEQKEEENRKKFIKIYEQHKLDNQVIVQKTFVRKLWPYIAAAAMLTGIIIAGSIFFKSSSPEQLADRYVREHFQTLGITMGNKENSLQTGLRWYNEGKLKEALGQFEGIISRDDSSFEAKKYAGIVSLRLKEYDKAIIYFSQLESYTLYSNPGKFYHALTLLKRNVPGDKEQGKILLEQVVQNNFEGKETAQEWLKKW